MMVSQEPPPKRIRRMMEEFDWTKWTTETWAMRVRVLQYMLANPNATNFQKFFGVRDRMTNFQCEDELANKLRDLWEHHRPADGSAEERGCLLEIAALMAELFRSRSVVYCDEANDAKNMVAYA